MRRCSKEPQRQGEEAEGECGTSLPIPLWALDGLAIRLLFFEPVLLVATRDGRSEASSKFKAAARMLHSLTRA
jgi:hypothetical protein